MRQLQTLDSLALFARLGITEQQRLRNISEFWDFYLGDQWDVAREDGENLITFNYAKAIVDKSVSFLFGKGFQVLFDKSLDKRIKVWLDEVWDYNDKEVRAIELGQMGGVTGDAFVKVSWEEPEKDSKGEAYDDLYPDGRVRIDVLPTALVDPVFHPHDKARMIGCTIQYAIAEEDMTGDIRTYLFREEITRDSIKTYKDEKLVDEIPNNLREINVIQIRNTPLAGDTYGQSDLTSIISLQKELNAKSTDVSDIINYHAAPITIIQGAKAKNLERGARKVWGGLPKDAKIYNLELGSDLTASNSFIDKVKTAIHELSNTPEDSLGSKSAISNTSGVALQIKYSPLLEKTWTKRQTYGRGLKDISRLVLKLLQLRGTDEQKGMLKGLMDDLEQRKLLFGMKVFFPDPLPKDELVQLQILAQKMNLGLEEPEGALEELGFDGDTQEKLKKIEAYLKKRQEMAFEIMQGADTDIAGVQTQYGANLKNDQEPDE